MINKFPNSSHMEDSDDDGEEDETIDERIVARLSTEHLSYREVSLTNLHTSIVLKTSDRTETIEMLVKQSKDLLSFVISKNK